MAKMSILFDGFADLAAAIDRVNGDLQKAVDEALTDTVDVVRDNLIPATAVYTRGGRKGYASGNMVEAIKQDADIKWTGTVAEAGTGFTTNGGSTLAGFMHSIFVMYGTPRMAKDPKVYSAIKGTRTKTEIAKKQEEVMRKHLSLTR